MATEINKKAKVSIGLLITISIVVFSCGVLWTKVDYMEGELSKLTIEVASLHDAIKSNLAFNPKQYE